MLQNRSIRSSLRLSIDLLIYLFIYLFDALRGALNEKEKTKHRITWIQLIKEKEHSKIQKQTRTIVRTVHV